MTKPSTMGAVTIVMLVAGFAVARQPNTSRPKLPEICEDQKFSGDKRVALRSPDGRLTLVLSGTEANLTEVETRLRVGRSLPAKMVWSPLHRFTFHCFTFSADGKHVITGSGFVEDSKSKDGLKTNLGLIEMWDIATGALVAELSRGVKLGAVREVALSEEGRTLVYKADPYSIDGK